MASIQDFVAEVRRIVDCPYTPCFKTLYEYLHGITERDLRLWSQGNLCHIEGLAFAAIEGVDQWPHAIDGLLKLCMIDKFREHVWHLKPDLLSMLLHEASKPDQNLEKYGRACTLLALSASQHALPAAYSEFFDNFIRWIANNLSRDTLQLLLQILCISPPTHYANIPGETLKRLQDEARRLLTPSVDRITELRCLCVLSYFSKLRLRLQKTKRHLPEHTLRASEEMFDSASAQHILGLLLGQAIAIVGSTGSQISLEQSIGSLRLATEIASSIKASDKTAPAKHKNALIQKLLEKITNDSLDGEVRGQSLKLVFALSDTFRMTEEIALIFRQLLFKGGIHTLEMSIIQCIAPRLDRCDILDMTRRMLVLASQSQDHTTATLDRIDGAKHVLQALNSEPAVALSLSDSVWSADPHDAFWTSLEDFATAVGTQRQIYSKKLVECCCPSIVQSATMFLREEIRKFLLLTAFQSQHHNSLQVSIMTRLVISAVPSNESRVSCQHPLFQLRRGEITSPNINESQGLQLHVTGRNWRDVLAEWSFQEANRQYHGIVKFMGGVCRDLESRCQNIEEPVRVKEVEIKRLQEQLSDVQKSLKETKQQLAESEDAQQKAICDFQSMSTKLALSESHAEELSDQLSQQGRDIQSLKDDIEKTSNSATQAIRQADLKNMEIVQEKNRTREEKMQEITVLRAENQSLNRLVENKDHDLSTSRQIIADQGDIISQLHEETSTKMQTLQATSETLRAELKRVEEEKSEIASARKADMQQHIDSIAQLQKLLNTANDDIFSIRKTVADQESLQSDVRNNLELQVFSLRKQNTELEQLKIQAEGTANREIDTLHYQLTKQTTIAQELRRCLGVCGPGADQVNVSGYQKLLPTEAISQARHRLSPNPSPIRTPERSRKQFRRSEKAQSVTKTVDLSRSPRRSIHQPVRPPLADALAAHNRGASLPAFNAARKRHRSLLGSSPARTMQTEEFSDAECESTRYGNSQIFASQVIQHQPSKEVKSKASPFEVDEDETRAE